MANIKQITVDNQTYNIRDDSKLSTSLKGAPNGLAELDENGIVKDTQLPSNVTPLYGTTADWNSLLSFVPAEGQIVVYADRGKLDGTDVPGIKIGDGNAYCVDLPFVNESVEADLLSRITGHVNNSNLHVTANDKDNWNSKVDVQLSGEILEFVR